MRARRILVAVDGSAASLVALETAATIAARLQADLVAIFVEDSDLVRLATLPFAVEIGSVGRAPRRLEPRRVERSLQALAARARSATAEHAERLQLRWSFRVVRGRVGATVTEAALEADLLVLGRASRESAPPRHLGSTAREALAATRSSVLLLPAGPPGSGPAVVVDDGSSESEAALGTAMDLVPAVADEIVVLCLASDPGTTARRENRVRQEIEERGVRRVRFRHLPAAENARMRLPRLLREEDAAFLVLPAGGLLTRGAGLDEILSRVHCPVLIAREPSPR